MNKCDKCDKCGAKVEKNANFCPECGEKIEREKEITIPRGYINIKVFIVGIVLAVIVGFLIGLLPSLMMKDKNVSDEKTTESQMESTQGITTESEEKSTVDKEMEIIQPSEENESNINSKYTIKNYTYVDLEGEVQIKEGAIYKKYPEIYSILFYDEEFDGRIEGDSEEADYLYFCGIHFLKSQPRDILCMDYRQEGCKIEYVKGEKFHNDLSGSTFIENIPEDAFFRPFGHTVVIKKEYLVTLDPGYYMFETNLGHRYWIIIHDETVKNGNYLPQYITATQFYSLEKKNDILYYMNGCLSPIKNVIYDYDTIDKKYYDIVCDGYGVVIHPEFIELHKDKPYISLLIRTESGLKQEVKIVYLK